MYRHLKTWCSKHYEKALLEDWPGVLLIGECKCNLPIKIKEIDVEMEVERKKEVNVELAKYNL